MLFDFDDDYTIAADETVQFEMNLVAPAGTPIDGAIAWNSFAYSIGPRRHRWTSCFRPSLARSASSSREAPARALVYGNYVWFDFDHDGSRTPRRADPRSSTSPLARPGSTACASSSTRTSRTTARVPTTCSFAQTYTTDDFAGNPGFYSFPELDQDDYYTVFDVPPGYELTQPDQGGDDTLDSDADFRRR